VDAGGQAGSGGSGTGGTPGTGGTGGAAGGTSGALDAGAQPTDFTRFIGRYTVNVLGGGITCGSYADAVLFSGALLEMVRGTESDLVVVSNPLPGEFPGSCTLKANAVDSPYSDLVAVSPGAGITCTSGAVTLTIGAYNFAYTHVDGKLAVSANGTTSGGPHGSCNFGYSAEAVAAL
jgi:hypothetical protein